MSFASTQRLLQLLSLQVALLAPPAMAAQEIVVNVSSYEASVSVQSLQDFGETGEAKGLLRKLIKRLGPEAQQQAKTLFAAQIKVDPVRLSKFLYTPQGETLLRQFGQILQSESGHSGFSGLRAALYLAAKDPEGGLTVSNVLKHVPGDRIRLNIHRLFELQAAWQEIAAVFGGFDLPTPAVTSEVVSRFPIGQQLELRNSGKFEWAIAPELETTAGDRATLYIPQRLRGPAGSKDIGARPVVFISHGLGGDRTSFTYLAEYLVSHGYVVVVPEHRLASQRFQGRGEAAPVFHADQALEEDWAKEVEPEDFAQRPRTVTRLLDELEKRQQQEPQLQARLDLERVGVVGQSFGAYTSLVLGGAQIDLAELARHCPADSLRFNLSLTLQCRALGLRESNTDYRDPRIKAIAAINPVGSALFGPEGMAAIEVPVLMMAGSHDFVTPPHAEQLGPFQWLSHENRYFAWLRGGTHFSVIQEPELEADAALTQAKELENVGQELMVSQHLVGEHHGQAKAYLQASSLAFFRTHLEGKDDYAKFLTPEFAAVLSQGKDMTFALAQEL